MAPTGVSAIDIKGKTINTALAIPKEAGENLPAMPDKKKTQMSLSLSELKFIVIDEVSMVSNIRVLHIHQRLKDMFSSSSSQLFAGICVVVVGDFYQLPPIRTKQNLFLKTSKIILTIWNPWPVFRMIIIIRQKDDHHFIQLLTRFRTVSQTEQHINCINSRSTSPLAENYPSNALHIWAEDDPVNERNNKQLEQLSTPLFVLRATDQYPPNVKSQNINTILSKGRSETGGLDFEVNIKEV